MKRKYFIDTNILVNLVLEEILPLSPTEIKNNEIFKGLSPADKIISLHILTEFSVVMTKKLPPILKEATGIKTETLKNITFQFLKSADTILTITHTNLDDFKEALRLQSRYISKDIDFADMLSLAVSKRTDAEMLTNDRTLNRIE